MSYEGYEEHICENGHRFTVDAMDSIYGSDDDTLCPFCKSKSVWFNCVDETNCDDHGAIPESEWTKLLIAPERTETCPVCHHTKIVEEARYRVPTSEEKKLMVTYRDFRDDVTKWIHNDKPVQS